MKQHIWIYGKRLAAVLTGIACLCAAAGCSKTNEINDSAAVPANAPVSDSSADSGETPSDDSTADSTAEAGGDTSIHVVAVGDNLVQQCVYQSAQAHSNDGTSYHFDYCYDNIKPLINGDLNIINQETLICGDGFEVSGSNFNFNSPVELGDAVVGMGFNLITMCNNHLLDKGESGLNGCLNYWDQKMQQYPDILACGVYRDYVDMQQIAAAKEIADVIVVTCHWGVEDTYNVTDGVKALAQKIIDWGGDVIIGTHPHVAQTMEYLTRPDGTQGFVFYSLGNFISAQTDNMNLIGELADFNIVAKEDGSVTIEDVKVSPVITQFDDGRESNLRLYPYSMYTDELAAQHGLPYCSSSTGPSYQVWSMEKIRELFDTSVPEQFRNYN